MDVRHCRTSSAKLVSRIYYFPKTKCFQIYEGFGKEDIASTNRYQTLGLGKEVETRKVGKDVDFGPTDMRRVHLQPYFSPACAVLDFVTVG